MTAVTVLLALAPVEMAAADSEETSSVATVSSDATEQPTASADTSVERLFADISW
ncbi:hypothetical protein ACQ86D_27540 [Streptomyces galilaeus]